ANMVDSVGTIFFDQCQHALTGHVVAGNERPQIERHHFGASHHVKEGVPDVLAQFTAADQLDTGAAEAFAIDVLGIRSESAGVHGTNIGHVNKAGAPCHELALVMNGRQHVHVGSMKRGRVRVVQHVNVAFFDLAFESTDDCLAGLGSTCKVVKKAHATHEQRAVGAIQADHQVVAFV